VHLEDDGRDVNRIASAAPAPSPTQDLNDRYHTVPDPRLPRLNAEQSDRHGLPDQRNCSKQERAGKVKPMGAAGTDELLRLWRATINTRNGIGFADPVEQAVREECSRWRCRFAMPWLSVPCNRVMRGVSWLRGGVRPRRSRSQHPRSKARDPLTTGPRGIRRILAGQGQWVRAAPVVRVDVRLQLAMLPSPNA